MHTEHTNSGSNLHHRAITAVFFSILSFSIAQSAIAQGGGGHQGGQHIKREPIGNADELRIREKQRSKGQKQQIKEQQHVKNQGDDPIYGEHLMSEQERNHYRTRIKNAASDKEREQIRNEHQNMIRDRAEKQGVPAQGNIDDSLQKNNKDLQHIQNQERSHIYGEHLMSEQERNHYRERVKNATSDQEREQIRTEHHHMIRDRAEKQGVPVPADEE